MPQKEQKDQMVKVYLPEIMYNLEILAKQKKEMEDSGCIFDAHIFKYNANLFFK